MLKLVKPAPEYLPDYKAALEKGWSPDNLRLLAAAKEELAKIAQDPAAFIATLDEVTGKKQPITLPPGATVTLPDGSKVSRLPGFRRWMWDGEFCGSIGFRWQPGTSSLPPYVLGHIGYSVVPWKQRRGYATAALGALLQEIKIYGLDYVQITTEPDNLASQKVVLANGGVFMGEFQPPVSYASGIKWRYHIPMTEGT